MCMDYKMQCSCGNTASFNFKDGVFPFEVIRRLYCPACSPKVSLDASTTLEDNGWRIEFDMDIARFAGQNLPFEPTPEFLFDEGYCTWRGVCPTDHIDSLKERQELVSLSKIDPKKYLEAMKIWSIQRMARLADEGWRKAHAEG